MRIKHLHLERFGHFTDRSIAFRSDAKLHVVFGPNEAGKSSALTAVTDLLFGIEKKSRYDFQRDGREMSLSAEITAGDDAALFFRRRRGPKKTLFGADGEHLGEDALTPFLGGLTRDVFCRAFGLDAKALREGADEMLKSEGEIGASLFAAASGLRGLAELRRSLDEEADAIYAPTGRKRLLNQLVDRRKLARDAIRASELRAGDWKQLNEAIDTLSRRLEEVSHERSALAGEQARLKRLKRVAPVIQQIDLLVDDLDGIEALPEIPDRAIEQLGALLDASRLAQSAQDKAEKELAEASAAYDRVSVDERLLAGAQAIEDLFSETKAYGQNRLHLPRIDTEAEEFRTELAALAVQIGLKDVASVEARQPSEPAKARIEALVVEGRALHDTAARLERELAEARDSASAMKRQRAERGGLIDPSPLRRGLEALDPVLAELDDHDRLGQEIDDEAHAIRGAAARLTPAIRQIETLATTLPSRETLARFRKDFEASSRAGERAADQIAVAAAAAADIHLRLEQRAAGRTVPSAETLDALRLERDRAWAGLRTTLFGEPGALTGSQLAASVAQFERAVLAADRLADDMAGDAQRAAEHAADLKSLAEAKERQEAAAFDLARIERERAELHTAWHDCWAATGLVPLPPAEMEAWLVEAAALGLRFEKLERKRLALQRLASRIEAIRPALLALARDNGFDLGGMENLAIELIAGQLSQRLKELAGEWEAARDAESRLRATEEQVEQLEAKHARALDKVAAWSGSWAASLPGVGLTDGAGLDEAEAALAAWRKVPDAIAQRDNRERRVAGMRRDIADYENRAGAIVAALAPELSDRAPDAAIAALNKGLQAARTAEARRDELLKRRDSAARTLSEQSARGARIAADLDGLAAQMGPQAGADLDVLHERLCTRRAVRTALAARRGELATLGEHVEEATLRAELAAMSAGEVDSTLARLKFDEDALERQGQEVYAERLDLLRRRRELEEGAGAEFATAQKRGAEVELRAAARRWAVLKLGATLLAAAMERHRTGQQDPLIVRAGGLFQELTGGAFEGLAQDYDADDVPRLAGRRGSGAPVPLGGLSEGTRDQLYLALRLAYLEDYAARAQPAPFIGDDLFSTFDDERTVHGLKALAAVGDRIQPILFTHHRHVADLAERHLNGGVDIVAL